MSLLTTTRFNNHELIGCNRFSDFGKLVRVLSWVLRFVYKSRSSHSKINKVLSAEELKKLFYGKYLMLKIREQEQVILDLLSCRSLSLAALLSIRADTDSRTGYVLLSLWQAGVGSIE
ncbi:hypothetical protein RRG08_047264 [Elysia crispata]|uniref:Uncharacterized protein n=1 Tax=Elysia crispata TaxID=231223 RepID=A0AAE1A408_9GAST|nr:hypothetical protein RRG08_047264 [Elysia crispata]